MAVPIVSDLDYGQTSRGTNLPAPVSPGDSVNKLYADNYKFRVINDHFWGNLANQWNTGFNTGILITPGSVANTLSSQNAFGILSFDTGNQAAGFASIYTLPGTLLGGSSVHSFGGRFRVPVLSSSTQRFITRIGVASAIGQAESTDGIYLRYTDSLNSGRFQLVCRRSNSEAVANTNITAVAGQWVNFRIEVNAALSQVDLYLSTDGAFPGTVVGSVTTASSIPLSTTALGFFAIIAKTIGGTARTMDLDLVFYDLRNVA